MVIYLLNKPEEIKISKRYIMKYNQSKSKTREESYSDCILDTEGNFLSPEQKTANFCRSVI